ncbi:hypothetical protein BDW71DRAFT_208636 [Aspergillus fruticulosus]
MASQQNEANLPCKISQRNPGRPRADLERYQIPSFQSQCHTPQAQRLLNNPVEEIGVSLNGSICPRCRAPRGHRPDCPYFNIIHERKAHKEREREKEIQQVRYEASIFSKKPVAAAAVPYGRAAVYPTGSAPPPPSAWPTAVINFADDAPVLLPLPSITAAAAISSSHQHVPVTLEGLCSEQPPMSGSLPLQNEDRSSAIRRSVTDRPPTPFTRPRAHSSSSSSLTSYRPGSATRAGTPSFTVTHRDQLFGDPSRHTPFELSSGLPLQGYPFTASARPTHIPNADPRLFALRRSLFEVDRPLMTDRPFAPASAAGSSGPGNLTPLDLGSRAAATGSPRISTSQSRNGNGKRSFSVFSADDSLFVSSPPTHPGSGSGSRHTTPYAEFFTPVPARTALRAPSPSNELSHLQPRLAIDSRISTTIDRVRNPAPHPAMNAAPQPPAWPKPASRSSSAPSSATASMWPPSSPSPPPPLPRPVPGYVWTGSDWHGPVWTCVLPGHMAAGNVGGSARASAAATATLSANTTAGERAPAEKWEKGGEDDLKDYQSSDLVGGLDDDEKKVVYSLAKARWVDRRRIG